MQHYLIYAHGGSYNHGAEASVKCDIALLRKISPDCKITLSSHFPEQDRQFHLDADEIIGRNINGKTYEEIYEDTINRITPNTIALSAGGDNYCYPNWQRYAAIHNAVINRGAKSILWSCSLDPLMLNNEMLDVLKAHHLITARESITYNLLKSHGLTNVIKTADIAFLLDSRKVDIPVEHYIVLNLSPLVIRRNPIILDAYHELINRILAKTDLNILLLPHVEMPVDNDYDALSNFDENSRVRRIPTGLSASEYKYIISKAELCIAARSHAAIAAYSSCVPVLAIGYSAKSAGIAADLGQEKYLLDIDTLNADKLCEAFFMLVDENKEIRRGLEAGMKAYKESAVRDEAVSALKTIGPNTNGKIK